MFPISPIIAVVWWVLLDCMMMSLITNELSYSDMIGLLQTTSSSIAIGMMLNVAVLRLNESLALLCYNSVRWATLFGWFFK